MNYLIHSKLSNNFSNIHRKLFSSIYLLKHPSKFHKPFYQKNNNYNPLRFFDKKNNSTKPTLDYTKLIHTHLIKTGALYENIIIANSLFNFYTKCGCMENACKLFDKIPQRNETSWNILISGYNQNLMFNDAWENFSIMHRLGFESDEFTYGSVLSACNNLKLPSCGKMVYSMVMKNGYFSNSFVRSGMINLFSENGCFEDGLKVFNDVLCDNVVCWNAIISGAVKNKENYVALDLFSRMHGEFLELNSFTFSSVLTACGGMEELEFGRGVQGLGVKCGVEEDLFVGTCTVDFYAKCGKMNEAVETFSSMPIRNVVCWTTLISGFVHNRDFKSALGVFKRVRELEEEMNSYTITSVIAACANPTMFREAMQIHCWLFKTLFYSDFKVKSSLLNMYGKIGEIELANCVFEETGNLHHTGLWTVMVTALAQNGSYATAINLFSKMLREGLKPDHFCTSSVLSIVDCLNLGRQIHCYTLKVALVLDLSVGSSLFTMYSKCGDIVNSYSVFQRMPEKDNVSWASMISGFAEHGCGTQGIQIFREFLSQGIELDEMTFTAVLAACSGPHYIDCGKEIHGYALRRGFSKNIKISSALVNMYCNCNLVNKAQTVFDMIKVKDPISCSSLVSGYAQHGCIEEAIQIFREMQMADMEIDSYTLSSVFGAVSLSNKLDFGTSLHAFTVKIGLESKAYVGSSLVMMYSKIGSIDECEKAFYQIKNPDLISWTSIITSYAQHGKGAEALKAYELMNKVGVKPDAVTFVGVLSACSHNGLVEEGYFHLNSMVKDFGIKPGNRHYACMVDVLGRSGRLKEAESCINNMPIKPNTFVWGTLLAACKLHGDIELGRLVARKVFELDPHDDGAYVAFSNICADAGEWEEVTTVRHTMKGTGVKKDPGWSYV